MHGHTRDIHGIIFSFYPKYDIIIDTVRRRMKYTVFYSWQSSHQETRDFLDKHIQKVVDDLNSEFRPSDSIVIDQDTADSAGSPHITDVLHKKIKECDLLIADISFVGRDLNGERYFPNPNVMYEVGLATAMHSAKNVILVFNRDLGAIRDLPFDIAQRKVSGFSVQGDPSGESFRKTLSEQIKLCIKRRSAPSDTSTTFSDLHSYNTGYGLDEIESNIMQIIFRTSDRTLIVSTTLDGTSIDVQGDKACQMLAKLQEQYYTDELVANIDSLARKGYLNDTRYSNGSHRIYSPTKRGYDLFRSKTNRL